MSNKLSINLLPVELRKDTIKEIRKRRILTGSVVILLSMVLITSIVLGIRFFQSTQNQRLAQETQNSRETISALKNKEELIFLLKNRIAKINQLSTLDSQSVLGFNLITFLIPESVEVNSFAIDKTGKISLSGETTSLSLLNELFENLTDPKKNEGKISSTKLEGLTKSGERIRFELLISLTGSPKILTSAGK